ncbi:poly-gamma-glutamate system protein [bacterium]|nr:poly-gamma-glutamate system protein [bacterium]
MSWRLDSRRRMILFLLAAVALGLQFVLDATRTAGRQDDYDLKLEAARRAERAYEAVREHRDLVGANVDLVNDPGSTGLVGPEVSLITNAAGDLDAKLTSLNPNFAAIFVEYFRQAGLAPGDPVAVAISGSFPGVNIALYAALEAMELRPVVITSVGASNWGANDPQFTWLDMETLFFETGIFHTRSAAATFGGGNDMGRGLSPAGRELIREAIARNGVPLLESRDIDDAIVKRMSFYTEAGRGRAYRLYVNVGGGIASIGSRHNRTLLPAGLTFELRGHNWPRKGTLVLMNDRGVPVVHLLGVVGVARRHGLPIAPDYHPLPGEGEIFVREMYRWPLAAGFLVLYGLACVLILAPEVRRGLFDRLTRRPPPATAALLAAALLGLAAPDARAANWREVDPADKGAATCVRSGGQRFTYHALGPDRAVVFRVQGPRRVKLLTRQALSAGGTAGAGYAVSVVLDGSEILHKTFAGDEPGDNALCDGAVLSALERAYVEVPRGEHELRVTAATDGGRVYGRLFRDVKRAVAGNVPYAPEAWAESATLQFESGKQSEYYRFTADQPLVVAVTGPTHLQLFTRLDFARGMLGSQNYTIEVLCDGAPWSTYHYDTTRLPNAFYPDRPDLLPGSRRKAVITVPAGRHVYTVRCVRPDRCGITARVLMPRRDLEQSP